MFIMFCFWYREGFIFFLYFFFLCIYSIYPFILVQNLVCVSSLLVGLLLAHPYIFYISLFFGIYVVGFYRSWGSYVSYVFVLYLAISSLVLGMYWGVFSYLWGFFWVDDLVEVWLFIAITFLCCYIHFFGSLLSRNFFSYSFILLVISLFFIRLGLVWTRHSFFTFSRLNYVYSLILSLLVSTTAYLGLIVFLKVFIALFWVVILGVWIAGRNYCGYMLMFGHLCGLLIYMWWAKKSSFYWLDFFNVVYLQLTLSRLKLYSSYILFSNVFVLVNKFNLISVVSLLLYAVYSVVGLGVLYTKSLNFAYFSFIFLGIFSLSRISKWRFIIS